MEPIETDRRGEVPEGSKPYFTIPVFNYHDGLVSTIIPTAVHRIGKTIS
jgi:hypothetical protein